MQRGEESSKQYATVRVIIPSALKLRDGGDVVVRKVSVPAPRMRGERLSEHRGKEGQCKQAVQIFAREKRRGDF